MKTQREHLATSPSQKSLTHFTNDSHSNICKQFFLPFQNQKRFTRKNNNSQNSSGEKSRNKGQQNSCDQIKQVTKLNLTKNISSCKNSLSKLNPGFIKVGPCVKLQDRNNKTQVGIKNENTSARRELKPKKGILLYQNCITPQQQCVNNTFNESLGQKTSNKTNNIEMLRTQLQIKQQQLLIVEDEKKMYKVMIQDSKKKQLILLQKMKKSQLQTKKIKQTNVQLQRKLETYESNMKKLEQQNSKLKKQLNEANKQKKIIQKQLNIFVNNKVPKNIRQLQSCRQISLEQTLQQMKIQIKKNKTQIEKQMQVENQKLKQQNRFLSQQINRLLIKNRLLQKKSYDSNNYTQAYKAMKKQFIYLKIQMKKSNEQCQLIRTQNIKIKKELRKLKLSIQNSSKKQQTKCSKNKSIIEKLDQRKLLKQQSQTQSLNLSISICQQLDESFFMNA